MIIARRSITALMILTLFFSSQALPTYAATENTSSNESETNLQNSKQSSQTIIDGLQLWTEFGPGLLKAMDDKDLSKAEAMAKDLMDMAKTGGDQFSLCVTYAAQGWLLYKKGKLSEATSSFEISLLENGKNKQGQATSDSSSSFFVSTSDWLAECYYELSRFEKELALENFLIEFDAKAKSSNSLEVSRIDGLLRETPE